MCDAPDSILEFLPCNEWDEPGFRKPRTTKRNQGWGGHRQVPTPAILLGSPSWTAADWMRYRGYIPDYLKLEIADQPAEFIVSQMGPIGRSTPGALVEAKEVGQGEVYMKALPPADAWPNANLFPALPTPTNTATRGETEAPHA